MPGEYRLVEEYEEEITRLYEVDQNFSACDSPFL